MFQSKFHLIIVTHNNQETIIPCLNSLKLLKTKFLSLDQAGFNYELEFNINLIDNASEDETVKRIKTWIEAQSSDCLNLNLRLNSKNRGFAAAVNLVWPESGSVILINPDTIVSPDLLIIFANLNQKFPGPLIAGGKILNSNGSLQASTANFPTLSNQWTTLLHLQAIFLQKNLANQHQAIEPEDMSLVDQVMGAVFYISAAAKNILGPFDPGFFIWFEEVDYCYRAKLRGIPVRYTREVVAHHLRGHSFRQKSKWWRAREFSRSCHYYAQKHWSKPAQVFTALVKILTNCLPVK